MGIEEISALWERQQDALVSHRRQRFEVIAESIAAWTREPRLIVDLGTGPGSLARLLLKRFPTAEVIALDYDPVLLRLAERNLSGFGARARIAEADLTGPDWTRAVDGIPEALVSATALHWLSSAQLMTLLEQAAEVLPPGGLFLNADDFTRVEPGSLQERAVSADAFRRRDSALAAGAPDWAQWWRLLEDVPGFDELIDERNRRFAALGREEDAREASPALHVEALRTAGFTEAGTLWQHLDGHIVYGRR